MNYQELNGKSISEGFKEFHRANPGIYKLFEAECYKAIEKGITKVSAKLIINVIRWQKIISTTDQNFKINDAFQRNYAVLFCELNPMHKDIFNFRKSRNLDLPPYMKVEENGQLTFM